jgi:hypothetical protein
MPVRHRLLCVACVAVLLLAGSCGGDDDAAKPAATSTQVAPAGGDAIAGSGYELRAARGWTDVKQQLGSNADVVLATQSGSVLNVLREKLPAGADRATVLGALTRSVLAGAGASKHSDSTPTTLDGADGIAFRVRIKTDRGLADGRVVIVIHDGYAYAVAGSTSPDEPVSAERALRSMLASWRWTGR